MDKKQCRDLLYKIKKDFNINEMVLKGSFIHYNGCIFKRDHIDAMLGYPERIVSVKFKASGFETNIDRSRSRILLSNFLLGKVKEKEKLTIATEMERQFANSVEVFNSLNDEPI